MKKRTIDNLIHSELKGKISFGESKHIAKQDLKFGASAYKIFGCQTYKTYLKQCGEFGKWVKENKGVSNIKNIQEIEKYVTDYLQARIDSGLSVYTVKLDRSALGMLFGKQIEIDMPVRASDKITRSRLTTDNDKHISRSGKYKDVFIIASACGLRRSDINKLKPSDFREINGTLCVSVKGSKGGRDRIAVVRRDLAEEVRHILKGKNQSGRVFVHIPKEIDIHSLRREYARELYKDVVTDKEFANRVLKMYPKRHEVYTHNGITKEITSLEYRDRSGNVYDRESVYIVTQCLGHNRLDVSVTHYLK